MNDLAVFGIGVAVLAGIVAWDKRTPLSIPPLRARSLAVQITNLHSCTQIPAEYIQAFQTEMNPWLASLGFPLLRTDGVLDTDTANWIDDVNTFYNGMHNQFTCPGVAT